MHRNYIKNFISRFFRAINDQFGKLKLHKQLLISFLIISILPMLIVSFVCYLVSYNTILKNTTSLTTDAINSATSDINSTIMHVETLVETIQYEADLQTVMRTPQNYGSYLFRMNTLETNTLLSLIQSYSASNIFGIYLVNENGTQYKSNIYSLNSEDPLNYDWFKQAIQLNVSQWLPTHLDSYIVSTPSYNLITYVAPYVDKLTGRRNGTIIIDIEARHFCSAIQNIKNFEVTNYYLVDSNDNVIYSPFANPEQDPQLFETKNNLVFENELTNGWKIVCSISKETIVNKALTTLSIVMLILTTLSVIFSLLLSIAISSRIANPIKNLVYLMDEITHGNLSVHAQPDNSSYEITKLLTSFNTMAKNELAYIEQIKEKQSKLRKAQFAALQAQINPHFLYNSMDTIAWNIRMDEKDKAISTILALTKFFRYSLNKGKEIITLGEELEQVSLYLQIQLLRYSDILTYEIISSEHISHYLIPKLVLQPIVENALYHGIKPKDAFGKITITVTEQEDHILIVVEDDGLGMTPNQIQQMNNLLSGNAPIQNTKQTSGYGIQNVNERIQIYYGTQYRLTYFSEHLKYTRVRIYIPKTTNVELLENNV